MEHIKIDPEQYRKEPLKRFRSRRDELVDGYVVSINNLRSGGKFKPITHKEVAMRLAMNPALGKSDDEIELLFKECEKAGKFSKFFWVCPMNKALVDKKRRLGV